MDTLPFPLVPADADLQDFAFTPMFRARLFGSSFHARSSDSGWRAGVTLWLKSWDQVPAGSLPADDVDLCRLAELGRDLKTWARIKDEALHGWIACSDGLLYHPVVAEGVLEAWKAKLKQRHASECARIKKANQRHNRADPVPTFDEWMCSRKDGGVSAPGGGVSQGTGGSVPRDKRECPQGQVGLSSGTFAVVPGEMASKRQGQGQREEEESSLRSDSSSGDVPGDTIAAEREQAAAWCRSDKVVAWLCVCGKHTRAHVVSTVETWLDNFEPCDVRNAIGTAQAGGMPHDALRYITTTLRNRTSTHGVSHLRVVPGGARQGGGAAAEELKPWERYAGMTEEDWRNANE